MKVSKEKFEELVSAYLDNEADKEEMELLSKCVRKNRRMAQIFQRECKLHAATCKLYGRELKLKKLRGIKNVLESPDKYLDRFAAVEWIAIATLTTAAVLLFMAGPMAALKSAHANEALTPKNPTNADISEYVKIPPKGFDTSAKLKIDVSADSTATGVLKFSK